MKDAPRAIIEVKHPVNTSDVPRVVSDVKRIVNALKRAPDDNTLDWGCVTFFCQSTKKESDKGPKYANDQIENTLKRLQEGTRSLAQNGKFSIVQRKQKALLIDINAAQTETRYGRACCIAVRRVSERAGEG